MEGRRLSAFAEEAPQDRVHLHRLFLGDTRVCLMAPGLARLGPHALSRKSGALPMHPGLESSSLGPSALAEESSQHGMHLHRLLFRDTRVCLMAPASLGSALTRCRERDLFRCLPASSLLRSVLEPSPHNPIILPCYNTAASFAL